jgi:NAD(P)-dependent dehydrogenase (short-subunit alcohol dehydrogenase family)
MGMTELERPVRRYPEMAGKLALVTGGTSGIGLATAQTFAREGAVVVLASRSEERAQTALQAFPDGSAVSWVACDTADGKSVMKLLDSIQERHGRLDYAFNNAGSGAGGGPVATMSEHTWRASIDGFLTSPPL